MTAQKQKSYSEFDIREEGGTKDLYEKAFVDVRVFNPSAQSNQMNVCWRVELYKCKKSNRVCFRGISSTFTAPNWFPDSDKTISNCTNHSC